MNLTLKVLLYASPTLYVSSGLGAALPTADDTRVVGLDGAELLRIRNQAVILTPFLCALFVPNDRLFAQAWFEMGFDPQGNPVDANLDMTGLTQVGRLHDMTLAQLDGQIGYWVYRSTSPSAGLRGLAPFLELHYNSSLGAPDMVSAGPFDVGNLTHLDELNLAVGLVAQIGDNCNLSIGAVAPMKTAPNRTFDYQLGIHGTIFFGPTARSRSPAAPVTSF